MLFKAIYYIFNVLLRLLVSKLISSKAIKISFFMLRLVFDDNKLASINPSGTVSVDIGQHGLIQCMYFC